MKFTPVLMYVCQFSDVVLHAVRFAVVVKWQAHRRHVQERRTSAFRLVCSAHSPVSVTSLIGSGSAASFDGVTDAIAESIIIIMLGDVSYCLKDRTPEQTYPTFLYKGPRAMFSHCTVGKFLHVPYHIRQCLICVRGSPQPRTDSHLFSTHASDAHSTPAIVCHCIRPNSSRPIIRSSIMWWSSNQHAR